MKTEQVRLALAIAQEKSISKAAAALFISQPTASNLLKTLEKEIGYSIFRRKRNGVTLTKEGAAFIEQAGNIERALRTISQIRHGVEHIELTVLSYHLDFSALAFEKMCEQYHSESYAAKRSPMRLFISRSWSGRRGR